MPLPRSHRSMAAVTLRYFVCQGRGETARLLLVDSGIAWTEEAMTMEQWKSGASGRSVALRAWLAIDS